MERLAKEWACRPPLIKLEMHDIIIYDDDGMEEDPVACRGQKRRLHTVCEISFAARSKMIKQFEPGIT